ncbi:MAG: PLP-dependent transferase, partial [Pseudomonadota bacterium]|nr:PLP-dependent transferase [Pseudomonadota bacterium]
GADIVIYSATKHIDGQGRCLGGIVLGRKDWIADYLANFIRQTGPSISPFNAWVMLKSLETMELRVHAHCDRAEKLAEVLSTHPKVSRLIYPGEPNHPQYKLAQKQMQRGGNLISFEVLGGQKAAFKVANNLQLVKISNNLGDAKSLITHPSTTTHQKLEEQERLKIGITPGTLRVSVGLEDPQDLIDDFVKALESLGS